MIIKRKLFSKKLTTKEKKQKAADQIDKTRKKAATALGATIGGAAAGVGLLGSDIAKSEANRKIVNQYGKHSKKVMEDFNNDLDKIRDTGDKVRESALKKLKKTGNPIKDLLNENRVNNMVNHVESVYKDKAMEKEAARLDSLKKATDRLQNRISKKASKRDKKVLAGAALLGTAAGLISNRSMKKRVKKLRGEE